MDGSGRVRHLPKYASWVVTVDRFPFLSVTTARRETLFPAAGAFWVNRPFFRAAFVHFLPSPDTYTASDLRFPPLAAPCTVTRTVPSLPARTVLSSPRNGAPKRTVETGSFESLAVFSEVKVQLASIREAAPARAAEREMEVVRR